MERTNSASGQPHESTHENLEKASPEVRPKFLVRAWNMGLRPDIDPNRMNQLAEQPEDEAIIKKLGKVAELGENIAEGA